MCVEHWAASALYNVNFTKTTTFVIKLHFKHATPGKASVRNQAERPQ